MPSERLQKIIAAAGIASRRKAEEMISSGLVEINGKIVTELGTKADPETDHIRVNGKLLHGAERHVYLLMNKPKGYVTTAHDPEGRPTVMNLLRGIHARVYPVGRLDYASEGLLILTNDGDLAYRLMKGASHVPKVYVVKVAGRPDAAGIEKLRRGLMISGESGYRRPQRNRPDKGGERTSEEPSASAKTSPGASNNRFLRKAERVKTAPAKVRIVREGDNPWYELTLMEGKNRQIRRMFEEIGHHVEKIKRVRYGPLSLDVPPGEFRRLSVGEIEKLKAAGSDGHSRVADGSIGHSARSAKASNRKASSKSFNRKDRKGRRQKH
jgi:23S rRNA pseudouridine2605 synthase